MAIINGYCSLSNFKAYITPPGQTLSTDATDDTFIEDVIERASRRVDDLCSRVLYPHIKTRSYDVPSDRYLWFGDDLLEMITLTNGDDTTIASTEYVLLPQKEYPKYMLKLRDVSTTIFESSASADEEQVIDVLAVWGYHDDYSTRGFINSTTINEGGTLTATDKTITMTSAADFYAGQIIKIENELMIVSSISGSDVVVLARGENGSTAATHANGTAVFYYRFPDDIVGLTLEIANMMYKSRYGENIEATSLVTPAGVIITPRSLPGWAQEVINKYKRRI